MSDVRIREIRIIEALIFASEKSISIMDLKKKLPEVKDIKKVLYDLQKFYKDRGIVLREIDNTWFFETADDISDYLKEHKVVRKKWLHKFAKDVKEKNKTPFL